MASMDLKDAFFSVPAYLNEQNLLNFFFNWDSLHARLKTHYEAWS